MPSVVIMAITSGYSLQSLLGKIKNNYFVIPIIFLFFYYTPLVINLHPYYFTYRNFWTNNKYLPRLGLGEGLDLAAEYLNKKNNAKNLTVSAWYDTTFSVYFKGITKDATLFKDKDVNYIVIYGNMYGRAEDHPATKVIKYLGNKKPEKVIKINNVPYIWIYKNN